jgi:glycosyltransferase involved in cell wall biosynthesis
VDPKKNPLIVYIITQLELGGAQKICLKLFEKKSNAFLISGTKGILADRVKENKNVLLLDALVREVSYVSFFKEAKALLQIIAELKRIKLLYPHIIVHTHSTKAGILGRWAAFFAGIKIRIHTIHGFGFHEHQSWIQWLPIYFCELMSSFITSHYICVSKKDQNTGAKLFPYFSKKNSLIRAAVDDHYFSSPQLRSPNTFFIFGTIACFKPQKNLFDLLTAFKQVHQKNNTVKLEIIGDGLLRPKIETWIKQHALTDSITLLGWQNNVLPFLQTWNCFVLSSLWEGLPCSIVEARLQKLPLIAYNTGGIHEIIKHKKNGFLVKQKDVEALSHYMLLLSEKKSLQKKFSTFQDNLFEFKNSTMLKKHTFLYQLS